MLAAFMAACGVSSLLGQEAPGPPLVTVAAGVHGTGLSLAATTVSVDRTFCVSTEYWSGAGGSGFAAGAGVYFGSDDGHWVIDPSREIGVSLIRAQLVSSLRFSASTAAGEFWYANEHGDP